MQAPGTVAAMAPKDKKQPMDDGPVGKMRALYAAGDVRGARRIAAAAEAGDAGARLRTLTDVDPVALWIGAVAIALGALYVGAFLL